MGRQRVAAILPAASDDNVSLCLATSRSPAVSYSEVDGNCGHKDEDEIKWIEEVKSREPEELMLCLHEVTSRRKGCGCGAKVRDEERSC